MLEVSDIHTFYGDSYILQGVSLKLDAGQCVSILGRNGAGKTTTLRSIMGLTRPRNGSIRFQDTEIAGINPWKMVKLGIAYVPENRGIFPSLTVREHLALAAANGRRNGANRGLDDIYELFPRLAERRNNLGTQLSGGEQQMLAIGRALIANPILLILDEPSEGLAPLIVDQVFEGLSKIRAEGTTILLVEQNYKKAIEIADYVYVLSQGQVSYDGTPSDLEANPDIKHAYLGF